VVLSIKSVLEKGTDFHEVTDKFATVVTAEVQKRKFLTVCLFIHQSTSRKRNTISQEKHNLAEVLYFVSTQIFVT